MRRFTILIAVLVCIALVFSGCKESTQPEGEDKATEAKETTTETTEATEAPSEDQEIVEITGMGKFYADFDLENAVLLNMYEAVGINISWEIVPVENYTERLTIVISSDDMPDIIFAPDEKLYKDMYTEGMLQPLNAAIDNCPNILQYEDATSLVAATAADGNIYGLPRNSVPRTDGFAVRQDWLDAVGITLPENGIVTLDQFTEIMCAFTEDDPDGNGEDDTYGWTVRSYDGELHAPPRILHAFGSSGQFEIAPEGSEYEYMNPKFSLTDTSYVEALKYMNTLWESGYIDPNWPANSSNVYMDRFKAGIGGAAEAFGGWLVSWRNTLQENYPDAEVGFIYGIEDPDGSVVARSTLGANTFGYWTVTKNDEGKEQNVMAFFDYMLSDEGWSTVFHGIEGVHYTVEDGKKVYNEEYEVYATNKSDMAMVRRSNSPELWLSPSLPDEDIEFMREVIDQCIVNVLPSLDINHSPDAESNPEYIDFMTTVSTTQSKIITGELEPEAWYTMLEEWYERGGTEYIEEMNEFIKNNTMK